MNVWECVFFFNWSFAHAEAIGSLENCHIGHQCCHPRLQHKFPITTILFTNSSDENDSEDLTENEHGYNPGTW